MNFYHCFLSFWYGYISFMSVYMITEYSPETQGSNIMDSDARKAGSLC